MRIEIIVADLVLLVLLLLGSCSTQKSSSLEKHFSFSSDSGQFFRRSRADDTTVVTTVRHLVIDTCNNIVSILDTVRSTVYYTKRVCDTTFLHNRSISSTKAEISKQDNNNNTNKTKDKVSMHENVIIIVLAVACFIGVLILAFKMRRDCEV